MGLFGGGNSSTVVQETTQQYDNRVGVEGEGVIAQGAGASYNYITEVPQEIVAMFSTLGDVAKNALMIGTDAVSTATDGARASIDTVANLKLTEQLGVDSQLKPIMIILALSAVGVAGFYFWSKKGK